MEYVRADCICRVVDAVVASCGELAHIDSSRVYCVASMGSRSRAVARIHGLSRAWAVVGVGPAYLIEVVSEAFNRLGPRDKLRVIIHELLHIPKTFSGALRPHGRHVNEAEVSRIVKCLESSGAAEQAEKILDSCPPPLRPEPRPGRGAKRYPSRRAR